jgi:prepilin-type N-terminal cleavage/methylation domain-containing protein
MKRPDALKREDGFTLIEIIAVLILLGILAAVAIPKYIDLQDQAEVRAVQAVRAELNARANHYFAEYLLDPTNADVTAYDYTVTEWVSNENDLGEDYTLSEVDGSLVVTVSSTGNTHTIEFTAGTTTTPAVFGEIDVS